MSLMNYIMSCIIVCSMSIALIPSAEGDQKPRPGFHGSVDFDQDDIDPFFEVDRNSVDFETNLPSHKRIENEVDQIRREIQSPVFRLLLNPEDVNGLDRELPVSLEAHMILEGNEDEPNLYSVKISLDRDLYRKNPEIGEYVYYFVMQRLNGFSQGLCFAGLIPGSSNIFLGIPDELITPIDGGYLIQDMDFHVVCTRFRDNPHDYWSIRKRDNRELDVEFQVLLSATVEQVTSDILDEIATRYREEGGKMPDDFSPFNYYSWIKERDQRVARILAERHGIEWRSSTELNPFGLSRGLPRVLLSIDAD